MKNEIDEKEAQELLDSLYQIDDFASESAFNEFDIFPQVEESYQDNVKTSKSGFNSIIPEDGIKTNNQYKNMPTFLYAGELLWPLLVFNTFAMFFCKMNNINLWPSYLLSAIIALCLVIVSEVLIKIATNGKSKYVKNGNGRAVNVNRSTNSYTIMDFIILIIFGWMCFIGILVVVLIAGRTQKQLRFKLAGYTAYNGFFNGQKKYIYCNGDIHAKDVVINYEDDNVVVINCL